MQTTALVGEMIIQVIVIVAFAAVVFTWAVAVGG